MAEGARETSPGRRARGRSGSSRQTRTPPAQWKLGSGSLPPASSEHTTRFPSHRRPARTHQLRLHSGNRKKENASEGNRATVAGKGPTSGPALRRPGGVRLRIVLVSMAGPRSQDERTCYLEHTNKAGTAII